MKIILLFILFIFLGTIAFGQGADSSQTAIFDYDSPYIEKPILKGKNLGKYIRYPQAAFNNKVGGSVIIEFIVEKNGTISNIKTVKGIGSGCDEEAERVIGKTNGKWIPGKKEGQVVRTRYLQTILFLYPLE